MRTVLLGTDFMYNSNGELIPIELNTNVGMSAQYEVLEAKEDIFDLTALSTFVSEKGFTKIEYIGNIGDFFDALQKAVSIPCEMHKVELNSITVPSIEDNDTTLIIRSAYDTTALIDEEYCKSKTNFLNLIKNTDFSSEFAYLDENGILQNNITTIPDNGEHPNFVLKASGPSYSKSVYPKLYKVQTQEELNTILVNVVEGFFLMPFYIHEKNIINNRVSVIRSMNLLFPPDLEAIPIGSYHKVCNNTLYTESNVYNENYELLDHYSRERYLTTEERQLTPKLLATDLVEMADGSFKTALDLQVGDIVKTLILPNTSGSGIENEVNTYTTDYDTLVSGSSYTTNKILNKVKINYRKELTTIDFTDGTDWMDFGDSYYLVDIDGVISFKSLATLKTGEKILLVNTNYDTPTYIEKVVESIHTDLGEFDGWGITVEETHIFLTKTSEDSKDSFAAIEHNVSYCYRYNSWPYCWSCGWACPGCPKGFQSCCNGWGGAWGTCGPCC